ncbi:hypothetical protein [Bradyrhizobium sp.]|jgi:hypothetical protein|nr:hypothetical protein [Bradyrhizobium sp.]HWX60483.1 hypothetical protein [Bradyrhizobium sp.]
MTEALHYQSIMQVSAALRSGKLSPVDLLEAILAGSQRSIRSCTVTSS